MPDPIVSTVANRHDSTQRGRIRREAYTSQQTPRRPGPSRIPWSPVWQEIGHRFDAYLTTRDVTDLQFNARRWRARKAVEWLSLRPQDLTQIAWPMLKARSRNLPRDQRKFARAGLRDLGMFFMENGIWDKTLSLAWTHVPHLLAALHPAWRNLLKRTWTALRPGGRRSVIAIRWRKDAATFIWWSRLPPQGPLTPSELVTQWNAFQLARALHGLTPHHLSFSSPAKCLTILLETLATAGWLTGPAFPCMSVHAPFWFPLAPQVRGAASRVTPVYLSTAVGVLRHRMLRYVLYYDFLCTAARPRQDLSPTDEEFDRARARLEGEGFSPEVIEQALADVRTTFGLARRLSDPASERPRPPQRKEATHGQAKN